MSKISEFDLSIVTLKELKETLTIIRKEFKECGNLICKIKNPELELTYKNYNMYISFIEEAIQIKTIEEMNKIYFGNKIILKNKLHEVNLLS